MNKVDELIDALAEKVTEGVKMGKGVLGDPRIKDIETLMYARAYEKSDVDDLINILAKHIQTLINEGSNMEDEIAEKTKALAELVSARALEHH